MILSSIKQWVLKMKDKVRFNLAVAPHLGEHIKERSKKEYKSVTQLFSELIENDIKKEARKK